MWKEIGKMIIFADQMDYFKHCPESTKNLFKATRYTVNMQDSKAFIFINKGREEDPCKEVLLSLQHAQK